MASKKAEKAPSWFTRILMPELVEIKGELKNVNTRMDEMDERFIKLDEMDKRLSAKIDSADEKLSNKIDSVRYELRADISKLDSKVEDLDKRLDIVQRLSVLEVKVNERKG